MASAGAAAPCSGSPPRYLYLVVDDPLVAGAHLVPPASAAVVSLLRAELTRAVTVMASATDIQVLFRKRMVANPDDEAVTDGGAGGAAPARPSDDDPAARAGGEPLDSDDDLIVGSGGRGRGGGGVGGSSGGLVRRGVAASRREYTGYPRSTAYPRGGGGRGAGAGSRRGGRGGWTSRGAGYGPAARRAGARRGWGNSPYVPHR